jgi:hypothetical protein
VCTAPNDQRWPLLRDDHALTSEITKSGIAMQRTFRRKVGVTVLTS